MKTHHLEIGTPCRYSSAFLNSYPDRRQSRGIVKSTILVDNDKETMEIAVVAWEFEGEPRQVNVRNLERADD